MKAASYVRIAVIIAACCLLAACGGRREGIADLDVLPQRAAAYLPDGAAHPLLSPEVQKGLQSRFFDRFFAPWRAQKASLAPKVAFWGTETFGRKKGFAENLQPWSRPRWESLVSMQMEGSYPSMARHAIATRNTSFRVMPTDKPFFYNPSKAGEGYPFDYMQNSAVWIGTPLLVTHVSADGAWYFAEAGITFGWLPADSIGWTDEAFRRDYMTGTYAAALRDRIVLRTDGGAFAGMAHLGAVFPISVSTMMLETASAGAAQTPSAATLPVIIPLRTVEGNAIAVTIHLPLTAAGLMPQAISAQALAHFADMMMGQPYGWGGLLENRDCSAVMRDLFAPFGIWLPRNSSQQGKEVGTPISLEGKTAAEKRAIILEQGIPFYTLLWFKGHIGLYIGPDTATGEPLLLHDVWGARTEWKGEEGRAVVGRLAVTTLRFAEERDDVKKNWFYDRLRGMVLMPSKL